MLQSIMTLTWKNYLIICQKQMCQYKTTIVFASVSDFLTILTVAGMVKFVVGFIPLLKLIILRCFHSHWGEPLKTMN